MIYCQTTNTECIAVHPMDNMKNTQFIELVKHGNEPCFSVIIDVDNCLWTWEFSNVCPSDYERVKLNIFDSLFECDTMYELAHVLDAVFHDGFECILIEDDDEW